MKKRKIKWGVLGTATIANNHTLPGMLEADNCQLYAIAGRNPEKILAFQNKFGFEKTYDSYDMLLDDVEVEAIYIPLPNDLHREWVLKAAKKKKHILCEKPLAGKAEEVEEMVEVCKKENVLLMEAFAYLQSNATRETIEAVRSGVIGKPILIESSFVVKKWEKENIRMRKETLGGTTYDQGCYNLSLIMQLLDEEPEDVRGIADFMDNGVDDYSSVYLKFPSGARAVMTSAMCSGQRGDYYVIYGSEGTLESHIPFNANGPVTYEIKKENKKEVHQLNVASNYKLEAEQFGRCIIDGEEPLVSNEFSIKLAKAMDRVLISIGYD
ncbi:MAG: Gfo/Idh/MocA family oxidoreductase [Hespellia sp.]|nr:Gfo/Idh/MocA family oxidoreductase [Hespellia sp.]